jgi:hypothetical protein
MNARRLILLAGICLAAATAPLSAHHSFAAEYDADKPVTLSGTRADALEPGAILNIASGFPLDAQGYHSAASTHNLVEAMRRAASALRQERRVRSRLAVRLYFRVSISIFTFFSFFLKNCAFAPPSRQTILL